jgi:hypothetical protein
MNSSDKPPQIRCRQLKDELKELKSLDAGLRNRVLKRFSQATLKAIEDTKENEWVPVKFDIELMECIDAEIGEKGLFDFCCNVFTHSTDSSMIGHFFLSALSLLKVHPSAVLRFGPLIWNSFCRNCGELSAAEKGPGLLQLALRDLPPMVVQSRPFLIGTAGSLQALLNYSTVKGQVVLEQHSRITNSALFSVSWEIEE